MVKEPFHGRRDNEEKKFVKTVCKKVFQKKKKKLSKSLSKEFVKKFVHNQKQRKAKDITKVNLINFC